MGSEQGKQQKGYAIIPRSLQLQPLVAVLQQPSRTTAATVIEVFMVERIEARHIYLRIGSSSCMCIIS
jgi:hypothetical protein